MNEIWTTNVLTNFEPPGPAYTFTASVVDAGSLPVPGQSLVRSFTVVVTDKVEAPSANGATFTVDENSAAGAFVANYGSPAYVSLGDAELTFDIVDGNTARNVNSGAPGFQFSALQTLKTLGTKKLPSWLISSMPWNELLDQQGRSCQVRQRLKDFLRELN